MRDVVARENTLSNDASWLMRPSDRVPTLGADLQARNRLIQDKWDAELREAENSRRPPRSSKFYSASKRTVSTSRAFGRRAASAAPVRQTPQPCRHGRGGGTTSSAAAGRRGRGAFPLSHRFVHLVQCVCVPPRRKTDLEARPGLSWHRLLEEGEGREGEEGRRSSASAEIATHTQARPAVAVRAPGHAGHGSGCHEKRRGSGCGMCVKTQAPIIP